MRSRGRVFDVSVCQFDCLFVRHFLAGSGILNLFKVSFSSVKMVLVNKLAFLCSMFERDHPEAQKSHNKKKIFFLVTWMLVKLISF